MHPPCRPHVLVAVPHSRIRVSDQAVIQVHVPVVPQLLLPGEVLQRVDLTKDDSRGIVDERARCQVGLTLRKLLWPNPRSYTAVGNDIMVMTKESSSRYQRHPALIPALPEAWLALETNPLQFVHRDVNRKALQVDRHSPNSV